MSYQNQPVTMWFDRRLVLRRSPIQGIGTFTTEAIQAGETLITVVGGIVFTGDEWRAGKIDLEAELYNQETIADNLFIVTPKVFHYYINHSCDANSVDITRHPATTHYIAASDIPAGAEITTDYGLYGSATIEQCGCQSPLCRGRISPDDRHLPLLREKFGRFFLFPST